MGRNIQRAVAYIYICVVYIIIMYIHADVRRPLGIVLNYAFFKLYPYTARIPVDNAYTRWLAGSRLYYGLGKNRVGPKRPSRSFLACANVTFYGPRD